ncbi:MAG: glucose-6-phosphate dehydrogenase, partial [Rhodobacterales bacterium]
MVSKTIPVKSFDLVIFGATGDLSKRKIIPALFRRFIAGQVPLTSRIIGVSRRDLSQSDFNILVRNSISEFAPNVIFTENQINGFCKMLNFISMDLGSDKG